MAKLKRAKFMYNKYRKHSVLVFDDLDNEYGYIGLTHARKTFKKKNYPLPENPEKDKYEQSYIIPNPMKDKKRVFTRNFKKLRIGSKNRYWFNKARKNPYRK